MEEGEFSVGQVEFEGQPHGIDRSHGDHSKVLEDTLPRHVKRCP